MRRTGKQNNCLHEYCGNLAEALNDGGFDFNDQRVIRMPVSFTKENVKEYMFKRIMRALYPDKTSTAELTTVQTQEIYNHMHKFISENFHINVGWPTHDNQGGEELYGQGC